MWMRTEYCHRVNSHLSTIIRGSQRAVLKVEYRQSLKTDAATDDNP